MVAIDIDMGALRTAQENAGVLESAETGRVDLLCANLLATHMADPHTVPPTAHSANSAQGNSHGHGPTKCASKNLEDPEDPECLEEEDHEGQGEEGGGEQEDPENDGAQSSSTPPATPPGIANLTAESPPTRYQKGTRQGRGKRPARGHMEGGKKAGGQVAKHKPTYDSTHPSTNTTNAPPFSTSPIATALLRPASVDTVLMNPPFGCRSTSGLLSCSLTAPVLLIASMHFFQRRLILDILNADTFLEISAH